MKERKDKKQEPEMELPVSAEETSVELPAVEENPFQEQPVDLNEMASAAVEETGLSAKSYG
jgi:hypothetical protein